MGSQRSHTPDYCPHINARFFYTLFESDAIFLVDGKNSGSKNGDGKNGDGKNTVRYRDLPGIIRSADYHLKEAFSGKLHKDGRGSSPGTESSPDILVGIDTTRRFDAILWMVYCWFRSIPFVPFSSAFTEPATLFRPDVLILTSTDTATLPEIRRISTVESEAYRTRIIQAPGLLSQRSSDLSLDRSSDLSLDRSSDLSLDRSSDLSLDRSSDPSPNRSLALPAERSSGWKDGWDHKTDKPLLPVSRFPGLVRQPDRLFCGLATSGSSGRPKCVALLRSNMLSAVENAFRSVHYPGEKGKYPEGKHPEGKHPEGKHPEGKHPEEKPSISTRNVKTQRDTIISSNDNLWGNCLPLYHTGGLTIIFRALLSGTGIYLWDRFESSTVASDIQEHPGIRRISLVPTMLKRLVEFSAEHGISPPDTLEQVLLGGGPAGAELIARARKSGWPVCFSYGMTETCGQIASQNQDGSDPAGSVGRLFHGHELSIRNEHGNEVATGSTGLLRIRGPQIFPGYFSDDRNIVSSKDGPDQDGWFETGDFARQDTQGNLFIEARRTDLIISGGENVNPGEVEDILAGCPLVSEVAVAGVSDEEWGQLVIAFVVPQQSESLSKTGSAAERHKKPEDVTEGAGLAVTQFAKKKLRPAQRPKRVYFVSELPRTSLGKTNRVRLQEMATDLPA